jgi:hypothetical protein
LLNRFGSAAKKPAGVERRQFQAEMAMSYCRGCSSSSESDLRVVSQRCHDRSEHDANGYQMRGVLLATRAKAVCNSLLKNTKLPDKVPGRQAIGMILNRM